MARSTPSCLHRCQSMEANGRTFVVNGYGFNKAAVGGGRLAVVATNGTALPGASAHPFRHSHRIAGGGRFPVRLSVVARRRHLHHLLPLLSVGAASTDRSSRPTGRIDGREAVDATVPEKKRSRIVFLLIVGAASTERSSTPPRRIAGREVVNATAPEKKRSRIVHRHRPVGAASTENSSRLPRRFAGRGVVNAMVLKKKRSGIVPKGGPVGAASTENSSRLPRRFAGRGVVNATDPEKKRSGIVPE